MVFQVWGLQNRNGKKTQRIAASDRPTYLESETFKCETTVHRGVQNGYIVVYKNDHPT